MEMIPMLILLLACGAVLLAGESLLVTHGVLGTAGLLCFAGALVVVFYMNKWAGLVALASAVIASPFIFMFLASIWSRSPVGRKLILEPPPSIGPVQVVAPGQIGVAITDLRPTGECDFGDTRVEAASELGIIHAGERVKVIALVDGRPTVRSAEA